MSCQTAYICFAAITLHYEIQIRDVSTVRCLREFLFERENSLIWIDGR